MDFPQSFFQAWCLSSSFVHEEVVKAFEWVDGVAKEVYVNPFTSYICCRPDVSTHGAISPQYENERLW